MREPQASPPISLVRACTRGGYLARANQRQAFNLTSLTRNGFPIPRSDLTSLTSHLTHARGSAKRVHALPSWKYSSAAAPPNCDSQHQLSRGTTTNRTSFCNLPSTRIPTHPRNYHSSYKPPPSSRHHAALSEAQAHRGCRSTRQGVSAPRERLQGRG